MTRNCSKAVSGPGRVSHAPMMETSAAVSAFPTRYEDGARTSASSHSTRITRDGLEDQDDEDDSEDDTAPSQPDDEKPNDEKLDYENLDGEKEERPLSSKRAASALTGEVAKVQQQYPDNDNECVMMNAKMNHSTPEPAPAPGALPSVHPAYRTPRSSQGHSYHQHPRNRYASPPSPDTPMVSISSPITPRYNAPVAALSSVHPAYRTPRSSNEQSYPRHHPRNTCTSTASPGTSTLSFSSPAMPAPVHLMSMPSSPAPGYFSSLPSRFSTPAPRHCSSLGSVWGPVYLSSLLRTPPPAYISMLPSSPTPEYTSLYIRHSLESTLLSYGPAILVRLLAADNAWDTPASPPIFGSTAPRSFSAHRISPPPDPTKPQPDSKYPFLGSEPPRPQTPANSLQPYPLPKTPPPSPPTTQQQEQQQPSSPPSRPQKAVQNGKSPRSPIRALTRKVRSPLKKDISWPSLQKKDVARFSGLIDPFDVQSVVDALSPSRQQSRKDKLTVPENNSKDAWKIRSPSGNLLDKKQWLQRPDRPLCLRERREVIMASVRAKKQQEEQQQQTKLQCNKRGCTAVLKRCFAQKDQLQRNCISKAQSRRARDGKAARRPLEEKRKREKEATSNDGHDGTNREGIDVFEKKKEVATATS